MKKILLITLCLPMILFGQTMTTLVSEDFNSGLPNTWYLDNVGSCTDGFVLDNTATYWAGALDPSISGNFMVAESYPLGQFACQADADIWTPSFDASSCDSVFVEWSMDFNPFTPGNDVLTMYAWDGFNDFEVFSIDIALAGDYWANITDWANSGMSVGFNYSGYDGYYFALDNLDITCWTSSPPPASWDCDGMGTCYDPGTGMGTYPTQGLCDAACVIPASWDCDGLGICYDPGTGNGAYQTLTACDIACVVVTPTWDCDGMGTCIDPGNGMGMYASQVACQTNCIVNAVEEQTTSKRLLKITDLLGRETKGSKNEVLFYIYDDGTVEKRVVIE